MSLDLERELPSGVYRHYKGGLYLVLGYAHDANADSLYDEKSEHVDPRGWRAMGERTVVVYVGLQLDAAHTGARLAVRTADDFFAFLHPDDFTVCDMFSSAAKDDQYPLGERDYRCGHSGHRFGYQLTPRFTYTGPTYDYQDL